MNEDIGRLPFREGKAWIDREWERFRVMEQIVQDTTARIWFFIAFIPSFVALSAVLSESMTAWQSYGLAIITSILPALFVSVVANAVAGYACGKFWKEWTSGIYDSNGRYVNPSWYAEESASE